MKVRRNLLKRGKKEKKSKSRGESHWASGTRPKRRRREERARSISDTTRVLKKKKGANSIRLTRETFFMNTEGKRIASEIHPRNPENEAR